MPGNDPRVGTWAAGFLGAITGLFGLRHGLQEAMEMDDASGLLRVMELVVSRV